MPQLTVHHWLLKPKLSSLLVAGLVAAGLSACGNSSSPLAIAPESANPPESSEGVLLQAEPDGTFLLTEPIPATAAAILLRLDVASEEPLPDTLALDGATFLQAPIELNPGFQSYVPDLNSSLKSLDAIASLEIPNISQASIQPVIRPASTERREGISLIYQRNDSQITLEDYILTYALTFLPESTRTPENIAEQASLLLADSDIALSSIEPIPDAVNTDWARGGRAPAPDLTDAAVMASALILDATFEPITKENLSILTNIFIPDAGLVADDIQAIPGSSLPGETSTPTPSPFPDLPVLQLDETIFNELTFTDNIIPNGPNTFYFDDYLLDASILVSGLPAFAEETVLVTLVSFDFDTFLQVIDPSSGVVLFENDDVFGLTNSQLSFSVNAGDLYIVRVTSAFSNAFGSYSVGVSFLN
ncbi:MAG: hypothetical protein AAFY57_10580 [Cyanobacteria bacterium J06642_2]